MPERRTDKVYLNTRVGIKKNFIKGHLISKSWTRGRLHMQGKQRKQRLAKCRVVNAWIMLGDHEKFYFTMKIAITFTLDFDPGIPWVRLRIFSCIVGSQKPSNTWGRQTCLAKRVGLQYVGEHGALETVCSSSSKFMLFHPELNRNESESSNRCVSSKLWRYNT